MKRSDITDIQVVRACWNPHNVRSPGMLSTSLQRLIEATGAPEKVCWAAMERAQHRGFIDSGVSLRSAWRTGTGTALLYAANHPASPA